jgi:regulator of replication initiation timing
MSPEQINEMRRLAMLEPNGADMVRMINMIERQADLMRRQSAAVVALNAENERLRVKNEWLREELAAMSNSMHRGGPS